MPLTLPKNYCWPSFVTRFVATSGFTPDVKVWEVKFSRSGDFEKAARAFDLTGAVSVDLLSMFKNCCSGHRSGVYSFAFSADSGKMATVIFFFFSWFYGHLYLGEQGWQLEGVWHRHTVQQRPRCGGEFWKCLIYQYLSKVLVTGSYPWDSNQPSLISLSPDGLVVAIAQVILPESPSKAFSQNLINVDSTVECVTFYLLYTFHGI